MDEDGRSLLRGRAGVGLGWGEGSICRSIVIARRRAAIALGFCWRRSHVCGQQCIYDQSVSDPDPDPAMVCCGSCTYQRQPYTADMHREG